MVKKQIFIVNEQVLEIQFQEGETLLEVAIKVHLPLNHSCGGMGTCGTCRILIEEGLDKLGSPGVVEMEIIKDRGFLTFERLACQNEAKEALVVKVPPLIPD